MYLNQKTTTVHLHFQARLTFQFFYPSLLCTIATVLYLAKPILVTFAPAWVLIIFHLVQKQTICITQSVQITLLNHMCNPFIYAYFNDRMKLSYKEMITCAAIRYKLKKRKNDNFFRHNQRHNASRYRRITQLTRSKYRRSNGAGLKSTRMSARSIKSSGRDGIVRSSLQMQVSPRFILSKGQGCYYLLISRAEILNNSVNLSCA